MIARNSFLKEILIEIEVFFNFIAMNSVLMKEVLNNGVDRHDFCELVGLEVTIFYYFVFKLILKLM